MNPLCTIDFINIRFVREQIALNLLCSLFAKSLFEFHENLLRNFKQDIMKYIFNIADNVTKDNH